jgi:hypothetical protein
MKRAIILALILGYAVAWATDSKPASAPHAEYLMRDGVQMQRAPGHGLVLAPGHIDHNLRVAAIDVSCRAIGRNCK